MNLKKLLKREIIITITSGILLSTIFFLVSYAIYKRVDEKNVGTFTTGQVAFQMCIDSTCSSVSDLGTMVTGDLYPMSNTEALSLSPYNFVIKNNSSTPVEVSIYSTVPSIVTEDYSNIKVGIKENTETNYTIMKYNDQVIILKERIQLAANQSKIVNVLIWGSEELSNELIGKTFQSLINAIAYYYPEDEDNLYDTYITNIDLELLNGKEFSYVAPTSSNLSPYQEFTAQASGWYEIEAWGAAGGSGHTDGITNTKYGKGGYTNGKIYLSQGEQIYVYVGGQGGTAQTFACSGGTSNTNTNTGGIGGYNGGGNGGNDDCLSTNPEANDAGGGGGGATDIRLVSGSWDNNASLNSRIMVAGGGGGSTYYNDDVYNLTAGDGGGLIGEAGQVHASETDTLVGKGGTQILKTFGKGFEGIFTTASAGDGGGGAGYYGGIGHTTTSAYPTTGSGGSSFISGYAGSAAIIEGSTGNTRNHTTTFTNTNSETVEIIDTKHYSGKYFVDGKMQAGVRSGNGQAKITYIGILPKRVNTAFNNVRYIKDCMNGSGGNGNNHWVDFQAIANGTNVAKLKVGTLYNSSNGVVTQHASYLFKRATDGDITSTIYSSGSTQTGAQCFVIDLGSQQNLDEVAVSHYRDDGRTYNNNVTYTSSDGTNWEAIIISTEAETSEGKRATAFQQTSLVPEMFNYTGDYQIFEVPKSGYYKIEAWGAQGGNSTVGKGAYTSGKIYLSQGEKLYVYVGQSLSSANVTSFNGGTGTSGGRPGGGATDIRLVSGVWNNATSLNSRIMVAAGSGAGSGNNTIPLGNGGGLIGYDGNSTCSYGNTYRGYGATQISFSSITKYTNLGFGIGGGGCGGGGGYYGGSGAACLCGGGGGSSFISGYAGVAAIIEGSTGNTRDHTTTYINTNNETVELIDTGHYSGKYFVDGEMQAGVRSGNGQAKITYIGSELPRVNTALNNVRYIKDCINGSSASGANHWVDFQAIANGTNIARGKVGTLYNSSNGVVTQHASYLFKRATDGDITSTIYSSGSTQTGAQCFVIDLGSQQNLDEVAVWHYWGDGRTYNSNVTYTSSDGTNWAPVMNTTEVETSQGKRVSAYSN